MSQATKRYHYTECGLPDVWIEGWHVEDDAAEETIRIPKVRSLHRLISKEIVTSAGTLTGPELRYLRAEMGLTQTQLGELVHRERLTVSRWERGESTLDGDTEISPTRGYMLMSLDDDQYAVWGDPWGERIEPMVSDQ